MVVTPVEKILLETQRRVLVTKVAELVADESLVKEIKELVGTGYVFKSVLKDILGNPAPEPIMTQKIRQRVLSEFPHAITPYDELIEVSRKLAEYQPGIVA